MANTSNKELLVNDLNEQAYSIKNENNTFTVAETAFDELKIMLSLFVPIALCGICEFIPQYISYSFVGHEPNSTELLASVGLSMAYTNCIGISITWGLTKGLDTLIPQALGQNEHKDNINKRISIYFQQSTIITFIVLIPILMLQYYAGDIMCLIGQSKHLCNHINDYCRALIPLLIAALWYSLMARLLRPLMLNTQNMFINFISAISSYPLNYLFIKYLKYNYIATAVVMDICMIEVAVLTTILLLYNGYYFVFIPQSFQNVLSKKGIQTYLYLSVPALFLFAGDWWISEIMIILTGYVYNPSVALAATSICLNLDSIFCEINYAATMPLSIRIGNYMGMEKIKLAKRAMYIGCIISTSIALVLVSISLLIRKQIPHIWISNSNEHVLWLSSNIIYFVCLRQLFYNILFAISGICIGLGYQKYTAIISTMCNYLIGFPLSMIILFCFNLKTNSSYYGVYIIWGCNSFGYGLSSLILIIMQLSGYINWNKAMNESQQRLNQTISIQN
eukprot:200752_1